MRRHDQDTREIFRQSFPTPSQEQTEATCDRVFQRLNAAGESPAEERLSVVQPARLWWRRTPILATAVLAFLVALSLPFVKVLVFPDSVYAVVESVSGSLHKVGGVSPQALGVGERVEVDTPVRTEGAGAVLKLPDGSRIEMHVKSELSLEKVPDGTRIRLNVGSVHVTPAQQPAATLYVLQVAVPAAGATFQAAPPQTAPPETVPDPRFDVISIRPSVPVAMGGRGAGPAAGGGASLLPCPALAVRLDPGRFIATNVTVRALIDLAYGNRCPSAEVLSGGPDWIRSERYDVQAIIPAGAAAYGRAELLDGKAPELQKMLQNLLAERFKLTLRRETKEMPAYNLVVVNASKLTPAGSDIDMTRERFREVRQRVPMMGNASSSMAQYATNLQGQLGRPVIDKTNVKGLYDFLIVLSDQPPPPPPLPGSEAMTQSLANMRDLIPQKLEEQLGLKLEPARVPVELLIVERIERPSEN